MNSLHNTAKFLRLVNFKTALNVAKECKPIVAKVPNDVIDASKFRLNFSPLSIGVEIGHVTSKGKIKQDPLSYTPIINPRSILPLIDTNWRNEEIGLPTPAREEKQAIRLIVIRRKKMKKHQKKKLWKKMRHRWAQVRQKRKQKKEKLFQSELIMMMKEADDFSAEQYVKDKLAKANHTPLPTRWKGKRLPEFIIRQLMGLDKKINYKHTDNYKA